MAGVIAMASVIEDFETQPCKKRKKDSDAPAVKTITNYFTPVVKPVEKPFSPPRSSNIMDYFKKTPPATKVTSPSQQSKEKELQPVEAGADPHAKRGKPPSKKPGRKVGRSAKKALAMNPPEADEDVVLVESTTQSEDQPRDASLSVEAPENTGNTTSLAQSIGETTEVVKEVIENDCTDDATATSKKDTILKDPSDRGVPSVNADPDHDGAGLPGCFTPEEKGSRGRAGRKIGSGEKADSVQSHLPETQERSEQQQPQAPSSLSDACSEGEAKDESQLNPSTVTVSFEDFLKSHSPKGAKQQQQEVEEVKEEAVEMRPTLTPVDQAADRLSISKPSDEGVLPPPTQVSPRTLTIQAEIHPISPDHDLSRTSDRKVASIFTACRRSKEKPASSPQPQASSETPPAPLRKSNVVLQEDDLELAVLEAGSSSCSSSSFCAASVPKCSQAERKQFMNAFKQPSLDTSKGKASKAASKQKQQPAEKDASADGEKEEVEEEKVAAVVMEEEGKGQAKVKRSEVEVEEGDSKTLGGAQKAARKRKRGRPKKEQTINPEEPTPPATLPTEAEVPATAKAPAAAVSEAPTAGKAEDAQPGEAELTSTPTATETRRRSTRELTRKQSTPASLATSSQSQSKHTESTSTSTPLEVPSPVSTPRTHHPKRGVYQSHMVAPPDDKGSPIRMKFTRVFTSPGETSEFEILSPLAKEDSKKRKKAQKLLQKAKAFQQSRQAATTEEKTPLRRSSRHQETAKGNHCESEDSIICVEKDQDDSIAKTECTKAKNQKQVRSLNEVLGKNTPGTKVAKTPAVAGAKVASLFTGKKPQRPSAVISIFDDSSRDASDTSLDDEQFRARREFLKSGLPESFKKQIAKTAASREAYTLSCSSFQKVVHVLQRTDDSSTLWSLPWPVCPRLSCLKETPAALVSRPSLPGVGPLSLSIIPAQRSRREQCVSGWRDDFSEAVRRWLLEEISASNPSFPTQRIFTQLLKRQAEHLLQPSAPDTDGGPEEAAARSSCSQPVRGKRKRAEEEDASEKAAKKQRCSRKEPETIAIPDDTPVPPRRGRGRQGRLRKQQEGEAEKLEAEVASTPAGCQKDDVIVLDSPSAPDHTNTEDAVREDVMWTEKYQPQHSGDVVGNMHSIRRLHSWLREWKLRADREERKKQQEKKQEGDLNDSWLSECGEEEDLLCNTLLIAGPTGVGKTAAVYACAQELGFKVFEVNCSSQRSGRQILSQLKEATQSHQVDIQGVNAYKPTFFNSYSSSSSCGGGSGSKPGSSPRKVNSPRRVVSSPHKPPQSPRRGPMKRGSLAPTSLANFFKMGAKPLPKESAETNNKKAQPASKSPRKKAKAKEASCSSEDQSATPPAPVTSVTPTSVLASSTPATGGKAPGDEQGKRTATSLILFEEVDVIFDDDTGFLAAIKTFMTTTKRPVILTTSDPNFTTSFDGYFDEIHFQTPSVENVTSYLRLLCLAENVRVSAEDVASLLRCNGGDVRQSLLQLQCWVRSGAGFRVEAPNTHSAATFSQQASGDGDGLGQDGKLDIPPCDVGCAASLLGLSGQPPRYLLEFIKSQSPSPLCWELVAEADRRGFDLLYSNMEVLLPLPRCPLKPTLLKTPTQTVSGQTGSAASASITTTNVPPRPANSNNKCPQLAETEDEASPIKVSSGMRQKKQHHPQAKDPFQSDSDSEDGFLSLRKPTAVPGPLPEPLKEEEEELAPPAKPETERRKRRVLTEAEKKRSVPVSLALGAMAEFLEHMSALDSSLTCSAWEAAKGPSTPAAAMARGSAQAEIRSGLTDEPRLEGGGRNGGWRWAAGEEQAWEIRAAVQSLSFGRCRAGVTQAWEAAQALEEEAGVRQAALEEITLPVAPHRQAFSITQDDVLCQPGLLQRRCEQMQTVCSSRMGTSNRLATALDVLPTLRTICRSEQLKEQGKVKRRFLHYLESINLGLPKQTLQLLAADFP